MSIANKTYWLSVVEAVLAVAALASAVRDWLTDSSNGFTVLLWLGLCCAEGWKDRLHVKSRSIARKQLETAGAKFVVYDHPPGERALVRDRIPGSWVPPLRMMFGDQNVHSIFFDRPVREPELVQVAKFPEAAIYAPPRGDT